MSIIEGINNKLEEDKSRYKLIQAQEKAEAKDQKDREAVIAKVAEIKKLKNRNYRFFARIDDNETLYEMFMEGIESPKLQEYAKNENLHVFDILQSMKTLVKAEILKVNELYHNSTRLHYMTNKISKKQYLKRMFLNYMKVVGVFLIPVTLLMMLNGVSAIMSIFIIPFIMILPSNPFIKRRLKKHYKRLEEICKDTSIAEMKFDEFAEMMKERISDTEETVDTTQHEDDTVSLSEIFQNSDTETEIEMIEVDKPSINYQSVFRKSA